MKLHALALTALFSLTGCGKQISDFVGQGRAPVKGPPAVSSDAPPVRLSAGAVYGTASQIEGTAALTPAGRVVTGSQVDAHLSLHRTPMR